MSKGLLAPFPNLSRLTAEKSGICMEWIRTGDANVSLNFFSWLDAQFRPSVSKFNFVEKN